MHNSMCCALQQQSMTLALGINEIHPSLVLML